jgi:hypothetical protein
VSIGIVVGRWSYWLQHLSWKVEAAISLLDFDGWG